MYRGDLRTNIVLKCYFEMDMFEILNEKFYRLHYFDISN